MDEYQLEIQEIRRILGALKADRQAEPVTIEEYEAELRNLVTLYEATVNLRERGVGEPALVEALAKAGFGAWTLTNVYSFVYETAMAAELGDHDLANQVSHTDYAALLAEAAGSADR